MRARVQFAVIVALILALSGHALEELHAQRSNIKKLRKTKDVKPIYPPKSLEAGDEGAVLIELKVDSSGSVTDARVFWSRCPALNEAALTAARAWQFETVTINGQPAGVDMTAPVVFRLPQKFKSRAGRPGACKWIDPPRPIF